MNMKKINKSYSELSKLKTFEERYEYLKINSKIGIDTFGYDRYLNQMFYHLKEWRNFRNDIIVRDKGCDLGIKGYEIDSGIVIHHINPISVDDILNRNECLFDPNNVIACSDRTHKAIHYGSKESIPKIPIERTKNDTCPWRN